MFSAIKGKSESKTFKPFDAAAGASSDEHHACAMVREMIGILHIPEGLRDIYGPECINKSRFEKAIKDCMHSYGYSDVVTPTFEYFDIFNKERGTVSSRNMFKFDDRDGNTLVLRPDVTPSLARVAAKYYKDCVMPVRLCYRAKQYINHTSLQGKLKETTQLGVEYYNDDSVCADFEVISLAIESVKACGVKNFKVVIGNAEFFKGLFEAAHLSEAEEEELKSLIEQKSIFGLEAFAEKCDAPDSVKKIISGLAENYGKAEILKELAESGLLSETCHHAVERLTALSELIDDAGYGEHVTYDFSFLSKFSYYTGVFFKVITYGSGEPIAGGGRYDSLTGQFGFEVPAIGMAVTLDYLMMSLENEKLLPAIEDKCAVIFYSEQNTGAALKKAGDIRSKGKAVRLVRDDDGSLIRTVIDYMTEKNNDDVNRFTRELETADIGEIINMI